MFSISQGTIRLFLFFGLIAVTTQFIAVSQGTSQRQTQITLYTEDGTELVHYNDSYALVIGNGAYPAKNGWKPLPSTVNDVKDVAEVLERHGFNVTLKIDITTTEFHKAFSDFIYKSGKDPNNRRCTSFIWMPSILTNTRSLSDNTSNSFGLRITDS